jgi:5-oxoprolinase (ATP-hydrolysing) subunit A
MTPLSIDLSCDLGEASSERELAVEDELWPLITSANIACGGHFGDEATMSRAVSMALRHGVNVGAHPSYPDRDGFGRRSLDMKKELLRDSLVGQLRALKAITTASGARVTHVKPHGALYNDAHTNEPLAAVILDAIEDYGEPIAAVCAPRSAMERLAQIRGVPVVREGFGDRRYEASGALVSRSRPNALLLDPGEAAAQARAIVSANRVQSVEGEWIDLAVDTICIHSDMPSSPLRLRAIRAAIEREGVGFRPLRH